MKVFDTIKKGLRKIARTLGKVCLVIMAEVTQKNIMYKNDGQGIEFEVNGNFIDKASEILLKDNEFTTTGVFCLGMGAVLTILKCNPISSYICFGLGAVSLVASLIQKSPVCNRKKEHDGN